MTDNLNGKVPLSEAQCHCPTLPTKTGRNISCKKKRKKKSSLESSGFYLNSHTSAFNLQIQKLESACIP